MFGREQLLSEIGVLHIWTVTTCVSNQVDVTYLGIEERKRMHHVEVGPSAPEEAEVECHIDRAD